jgi:hypothetical protein
MKWLERKERDLRLAEQMLRLYLDSKPDFKGPLVPLRYRFMAELENGLFITTTGPDHQLTGFVTWWRMNDDLYEQIKESDEVFPPVNGPARQGKPRWVYVSSLCASNQDDIRYLLRRMRKLNADCKLEQFVRWRKGRLLHGGGL